MTVTVEGFRHEALLHAGLPDFLDGAVAFLREGLDRGERIMVAVTAPKLAGLRDRLTADEADRIRFADMEVLGANPARIIPAWGDFLDEDHGTGRGAQGIGEPIWPGRSPEELVECHRHESLLNLAFAEARAFTLLCPYDTAALDPAVIEEAERNHPVLVEGRSSRASECCRPLGAIVAPFTHPLPDPPATAAELTFDGETLAAVRQLVESRARDTGIVPPRSDDLVLAVNEIMTNSIRHAGGGGTLRAWTRADGTLVFEVRDHGGTIHPLAGRQRPVNGQLGGYGLWLANQVCDLVQLRTFAGGNVVRLHMRTA